MPDFRPGRDSNRGQGAVVWHTNHQDFALTSQDTSQPASAVIYYMPDGYSMSGRRLMGRQSAGASFLAGYARHATVRDFVCMAPDRKAAEAFAETVQPVGRPSAAQRPVDPV